MLSNQEFTKITAQIKKLKLKTAQQVLNLLESGYVEPTLAEEAFDRSNRKAAQHVIRTKETDDVDLLRQRERKQKFKVRTSSESLRGQPGDPSSKR